MNPPTSSPTTARAEALRIITRLVGAHGVQSFLKCPQPALGDRTGAELLQHDPDELLRRLKWIDAESGALDDDELVGDPAVEHFARPRKLSASNRVLEILDQLERSGDE